MNASAWSLLGLAFVCCIELCRLIVAAPNPARSSADWRIQERTIQLTVDENCRVGTDLGTVMSAWLSSGTTSSGGSYTRDPTLDGVVRYQFGAPSSLFALDEQRGRITTVAEIDAEALCAKARAEEAEIAASPIVRSRNHADVLDRVSCSQSGHLTVHMDINTVRPDGSLVSVFRTLVHVRDLNDNRPVFDQTRWHRQLKEALYQKGRRLDLPKAVDADISPENRQIRYRLEQSSDVLFSSGLYNGPFALEVSSTGQLSLILLEDLDAELQATHRLTLVAYSPIPMAPSVDHVTTGNGSALSESRLEIDIEVLDMNDNEPRFQSTVYNISVSEDTPINTVIYQLVAQDPDRTASLTYAIVESEKGSLASSTFSVAPDGRVLLRGLLDYEFRQSHEIPVEVKDGEFTAHTTLLVRVLDVNDEPPGFEVNPEQLVAHEHAVPGKLIGRVRVYDPDSETVNGKVYCSEPPQLQRSQALAFVPDPSVHPTSGVYDLTTRFSLDRESGSAASAEPGQLLVYLVCTDGNDMYDDHHEYGTTTERHTSTMTATLTVRDENDHVPVFDRVIYHASIRENNPIGQQLIRVSATDPDEGKNAEIVYSILDRANFKVDPVTGWISANQVFDRETRDSYQVSVVATDQGTPRLSTSVLLNLTVLDANDHAPRLVTYGGSRDSHTAGTGTRTPLDAAGRENVFHVLENAPPNTYVGDVQAIDEDLSENARIQYSLMEDKAVFYHTRFRLLRNGSLFTTVALDREEKDEYLLTVLLSDSAPTNALSTTGTITVIVRDANDNAPQFLHPKGLLPTDHTKTQTENTYLLYDQPMSNNLNEPKSNQKRSEPFAEPGRSPIPDETARNDSQPPQANVRMSVHEQPGYLVTTLQATDPDSGENGQITYEARELARPHSNSPVPTGPVPSLIRIDPSLGHVILQRSLDPADLGFHFILVTASDRGEPHPMKDSKLLILLVEDVPAVGLVTRYAAASNRTEAQLMGVFDSKHKLYLVIFFTVFFALFMVALVVTTCVLCRTVHGRRMCCKCPGHRKRAGGSRSLHDNRSAESDAFSLESPTPKMLEADANGAEPVYASVIGTWNKQTLQSDSYDGDPDNRRFQIREDESREPILDGADITDHVTNLSPGIAAMDLVRPNESPPDLLAARETSGAGVPFVSGSADAVAVQVVHEDPSVISAGDRSIYASRPFSAQTDSPHYPTEPKHLLHTDPARHDWFQGQLSQTDNVPLVKAASPQSVRQNVERVALDVQTLVSPRCLQSLPDSVALNQLFAATSLSYAPSSQPLLIAASGATTDETTDLNQLKLVNLVVNPAQSFPFELVSFFIREQQQEDSGSHQGNEKVNDAPELMKENNV